MDAGGGGMVDLVSAGEVIEPVVAKPAGMYLTQPRISIQSLRSGQTLKRMRYECEWEEGEQHRMIVSWPVISNCGQDERRRR